jgi:CRP-like cAMP-binding protein
LSIGDGSFPKSDPSPPGMPPSGLNLFERVLSLRAAPLFHNAGVQATLLLAEASKEIDLDPGEKLYAKDEVIDCIHVVAGGAVRVEREEPVLRASFGPGAWVSGGSALGVERAAFDAYADGPAVILAIDREDLFDIMEDHFDLTRSLLAGFNLERERILDEHGVLSDAQIARGERASLLPQRLSVRLA